jgi:hypothetical protein
MSDFARARIFRKEEFPRLSLLPIYLINDDYSMKSFAIAATPPNGPLQDPPRSSMEGFGQRLNTKLRNHTISANLEGD